jgi:exonuclease SbcC
MSAVIESLKVRNFEGYKDAKFPFSAGLNLIKGRNSTGKSTILDAISYALFGEAPDVDKKLLVSRLPGSIDIAAYIKFRSPKTKEIVEVDREGKLDTKGGYRNESLHLRINGKEVTVEGDEDLRAKITTLLGTSFRQFMNLVYVRQGKLTAILEPSDKQMDSILGITLLRELHAQFDEAKKHLEKYEGNDIPTEVNRLENTEIPQHKRTLSDLANEIPALQKEVDGLGEAVKKGESKELQTLLRQVDHKKGMDDKLHDLASRTQQLFQNADAKTLDEIRRAHITYSQKHEALEKQMEIQSKIRDQLHDAWTKEKGRAEALEEEIAEHEDLLQQGLAKCPKCGQPLSASKLKTQLQASKAKLSKLQTQAKQSKKEYDEAKERFSGLDDESRNARNTAKALKQYVEQIVKYETEKRRISQEMEKELNEIRITLKALGLQLDPQELTFERMLASQIPVTPTELEKNQADLKKKSDLLKEKRKYEKEIMEKKTEDETKLERLKKRLEKASLARQLAEGFEQAIEERRRSQLKSIEVRALQYYKSMTDQHTYSAISIDPETYRVYVFPKGLTDRIPATRTGGGHQTLISLALRLALLQELNSRSLLILDEPTYGVDEDNLRPLASQLEQASKQLSQTIIVTHYGIFEEDAANTLNVVVGPDGVSKIESNR